MAERRRKIPDFQGRTGEEQGRPRQPQAAFGGVIYLREEADRRKMFIVEEFID
jgi:hypothetical protein